MVVLPAPVEPTKAIFLAQLGAKRLILQDGLPAS